MLIDLLRKRRSIRRYKETAVEKGKIDLLIEAALRSPSSRSLNPWQFIIVREKNMLQKLSESKKHGASFLKHAPLGIVVLADPEKCDVWIEDTSIASLLIHITASSLDLGSCWIQIRERYYDETRTSEDYVRELLSIPEHLKVESIIAVGYPDETKEGHPSNSLLYENVFAEKYNKNW